MQCTNRQNKAHRQSVLDSTAHGPEAPPPQVRPRIDRSAAVRFLPCVHGYPKAEGHSPIHQLREIAPDLPLSVEVPRLVSISKHGGCDAIRDTDALQMCVSSEMVARRRCSWKKQHRANGCSAHWALANENLEAKCKRPPKSLGIRSTHGRFQEAQSARANRPVARAGEALIRPGQRRSCKGSATAAQVWDAVEVESSRRLHDICKGDMVSST